MQPNERYDIILQMLSSKEMVTIPELIETFDVSIETVRRDLTYLAEEKLIKKVYGGAILFNRAAGFTAMGSQRMCENLAEKDAIGRSAAELIHDGETLFMGPGSTVLQVAHHLKNHKNLTVITNSIYIVNELLDTDAHLFIIGGEINNEDGDVALTIPRNAWDCFSAPKAIVSAGGISTKYGITDFNLRDSQLLKDVLERAMNVIVVVDNSKFGLVHPCITCPLSRVGRIVTGSAQKDEILQDFADYRQRFLFADGYEPGQTIPGVL